MTGLHEASTFLQGCAIHCRRAWRRPVVHVIARGSRQTRLATRITTIPRRVDLYFADRPFRRALWAAIAFYSGFYCANTGQLSALTSNMSCAKARESLSLALWNSTQDSLCGAFR